MVVTNNFEKLSVRIQQQNKKNNENNHENITQNRDYINLKKYPSIPNISPKIKRGKVYNKFSVRLYQILLPNMYRTLTTYDELKMGIIWVYKTNKRMPWKVRLTASKNSTHFTIHVRMKNPQSAQNKQAKNN